jgi:hypothetical protein
MRSLLWYLWIAPYAVLAIVLTVFLRRGLKKQLPFFFSYIVFLIFYCLASVAADRVVVFYHTHPSYIYRWVLVCGLGISALLSFGVIYELVNQTILYRSALAQSLRPVLRGSAAVLVLLTAAATGRMAASGGIAGVLKIFQLLDFSSSVLQVGLLFVLFLFSRVLRISWSSFPVGIALGLGISGCAELSATGLLSALPPGYYPMIDVLRLGAFHVCVLVWLGYLIFPEQGPKFNGTPPQESDLDSWNQELQKMVR